MKPTKPATKVLQCEKIKQIRSLLAQVKICFESFTAPRFGAWHIVTKAFPKVVQGNIGAILTWSYYTGTEMNKKSKLTEVW